MKISYWYIYIYYTDINNSNNTASKQHSKNTPSLGNGAEGDQKKNEKSKKKYQITFLNFYESQSQTTKINFG